MHFRSMGEQSLHLCTGLHPGTPCHHSVHTHLHYLGRLRLLRPLSMTRSTGRKSSAQRTTRKPITVLQAFYLATVLRCVHAA